MQIVINITSIVISFTALYFGIQSYRNAKIAVVKEFFVQGDSRDQKNFRKQVYDIYNRVTAEPVIKKELIKITDAVAHIVSFYDFWALMVEKKYLPMWTFDGTPGNTAINVFSKIKPYIDHRREKDAEYAKRFERLVNRIKTP